MTQCSILEYAQALRPRYRKASEEEKNRMQREFVQVTGFHRKAVTGYSIEQAGLARASGAVGSGNMV